MKKEINIGQYNCGGRMVDLIGVLGQLGGSVEFNKPVPEVRVGLGGDHWGMVVSVLLHEAQELTACDLRLRFRAACDWQVASDSYFFHFDHNQFSEVCARAGYFISQCLPALSKAYKKHGPR